MRSKASGQQPKEIQVSLRLKVNHTGKAIPPFPLCFFSSSLHFSVLSHACCFSGYWPKADEALQKCSGIALTSITLSTRNIFHLIDTLTSLSPGSPYQSKAWRNTNTSLTSHVIGDSKRATSIHLLITDTEQHAA